MVTGVSAGLESFGVETKVISPEKEIYSPLGLEQTEVNYRNLGKKAVNWCWRNNFRPDWLWLHDWGGVWSAKQYLGKVSQKPKVIWTVHSPVGNNYGYEYGYENPGGTDKPIDWGDSFFNFSGLIKEGVKISDLVTTVSGSFARRLERHQLFSGAESVIGINNGINEEEWNPYQDRLVDYRLKRSWLEFKERNKVSLQRKFGLPEKEVPVFAFVSRMVPQKGLDLLLKVLPKFIEENDLQFVFVGSGKKKYCQEIEKLRNCFPEKIAAKLEADFELPHQVFAGADFLVLPSVAEPFGLVVAEAKKYGAVPIVHLVDGLQDQVKDGKNGFGFQKYQEERLAEKLYQALGSWSSEWRKKRLGDRTGIESWSEVAQKWLTVLYE